MKNLKLETYRIRSGTQHDGDNYELITILQIGFHLLSVSNIKEFQFSSNNESWGDFDDVVVEIVLENGALVTLALQLKHTSRSLHCKKFQSAKHDFSLDKYFKTYKKLYEGDFNLDGIYFVLYTTAPCQDSKEEFVWHKSLLTKKKCNSIEYLPDTGKCFKFSCLDKDLRSKFLSNFFLYTNQLNYEKMLRHLVNKTENRFGVHHNIIEQFLMFLNRWRNGHFGENYKISKHEFVLELCELLFSPYIQEPTFTHHDNFKYENLLKKIIETVDVTFIKDSQMLPLIWFLILQKNEWQQKKQLTVKELQQFLPKHHLLKKQKENEIRDKDLYLILWKCGLAPLFLIGNGNVDAILSKIILFAKRVPFTHFIVCTNNTQPYQNISKFSNLFDLNQKSRILFNETLKNVSLKIQNRFELSLDEMYKMDDDVLFKITPDLLLEIMIGKALSDNEETENIDIYIERQILSLYLHMKQLSSVTNETIYILCNLHNHFRVFKKQYPERVVEFSLGEIFLEYSRKNIVLVEASMSLEVLQNFLKKRKFSYYLFQLIEYDSEYFLQLIAATGPINRINIVNIKNCINDRDILSLKNNMINVISASSGMGKTTLINQIYKLYPEKIWIVKIDLRSIQIPSNHLTDYFFYNSTDELTQICFDLFKKNKQIIYLFDGFDEIDTKDIEKCLEMFDNIKRQNIIQWITTKPARSAYLENKFYILPLTLNMLDENDKEAFFNAYKDKYIGEHLKEWFKKTIIQVSQSLDSNLTNNPLQIYMICELVKNNTDNRKVFDPNNILLLYEKFIKMKLERYELKYFRIPRHPDIPKSKWNNNASFKTNLPDHLKSTEAIILNMQYCSLISIFSLARIKDNFFGHTNHGYVQCGIISHMSNNTPVFVHSSYAEYFAATWFAEHWTNASSKALFLEIYFSENHILFKQFFDRLVSKDYKVFNAIFQDNFKSFSGFVKDDLKILDQIGRNVLHLLCSLQPRNNILSYINVFLTFGLEQITSTDNFLNLTPFEYAIKTKNTIVVEKLLSYQNFTIDFEKEYLDYENLVSECIKNNCHQILGQFVTYLNNNWMESPTFQMYHLINLLSYAIEVNNIDSTRLLLEINDLKKYIEKRSLKSISVLCLAIQNTSDIIKNLFDNFSNI